MHIHARIDGLDLPRLGQPTCNQDIVVRVLNDFHSSDGSGVTGKAVAMKAVTRKETQTDYANCCSAVTRLLMQLEEELGRPNIEKSDVAVCWKVGKYHSKLCLLRPSTTCGPYQLCFFFGEER